MIYTFLMQALGQSAIPCPPEIACPGQNGFSTGGGIDLINSGILNLINWLLGFTFGLTVLFLVIGGFWYIVSAGNEERAAKGKSTVLNAIIGLIIIILSYAIVNYAAQFAGGLGTGTGIGTAP